MRAYDYRERGAARRPDFLRRELDALERGRTAIEGGFTAEQLRRDLPAYLALHDRREEGCHAR